MNIKWTTKIKKFIVNISHKNDINKKIKMNKLIF